MMRVRARKRARTGQTPAMSETWCQDADEMAVGDDYDDPWQDESPTVEDWDVKYMREEMEEDPFVHFWMENNAQA